MLVRMGLPALMMSVRAQAYYKDPSLIYAIFQTEARTEGPWRRRIVRVIDGTVLNNSTAIYS